ncbi:hypothetical protein EPUL_003745 [Erysiphe pulchra]|uniref:Tag1 C-terminal domain-containing protein n=1 Tax=Erysiphe pulchra TaxID=225359 RepID=A0A2S4PVL0_9PEZI|nr:hypothetical protein EPUL_003745 [Erysiphe pulchra]
MLDEQPSRILKSSSRSSIDFNESQPLLLQTDHNQRYDGSHDSDSDENENLRRSGKSSRKEASRWPTLISIIVTVSLTIAILLLMFIAPSFIEEYAKQAVSIKPTKLSVDSFTSTGLKARVQADFRVDASQVSNKYLRNFGKLSTLIAKEVGSDQSEVQVFLPDYDNLLICTVTVPKIQVDIRDDHNTPLDFLIDMVLEDKNGIQIIANKWLEGGLDRIQILAKAKITLKSGMFSLPAQPISKFLVFEGNDFPKIPHYNIDKLNFNEISIPSSGINGLAIDASVFIDYNQIIELDIPALRFEILVQGCGVGNFIQLISIRTDFTHLYPRLGSLFQVKGIITELPQPLLQTCPESELSPLENLISNYVHGNNVTVLIRGSNSPSQRVPDWISEIFSKIRVPLTLPSHKYHGLIRNFTISDINFKLPDLFAEPDSDKASPKLSGHLEAIADIPKEINFNMSVSQARASVDVLYKESKFGELDLHEWQKVNSHARRPLRFRENVSVGLEEQNIFDDIPPEKFEECRYDITTESLNSAIQNGVIDLATKYGNDAKGPAFPFRPFTENGKQLWPNSAKIMDLNSFKKELNQNPDVLFQEFKFRSLGLMVLMTEIYSLHEIAQCLDHNQTCFYNMLMSLKDKLSSNQKDPDYSLMTELVIREKQIVDLNQQLAETNQVVVDLMIRGRNLSAPILENSGTPSTQYTEKGTKIERSARVDDPDQFFDEVGKDKLDFDGWRLGVKARL